MNFAPPEWIKTAAEDALNSVATNHYSHPKGRIRLREALKAHYGPELGRELDVEKILVIRRMKPLGFTLEQMSAAMRDIEVLRDRDAGDRYAEARERLTAILADAAERREKLQSQLAMADEFISQLGRELT